MLRRFDTGFMRPPASRGAVNPLLLTTLRAWCEAGALPRCTVPLAVAHITPQPGLDAVAAELDGSHALVRLGRWRGWAWRLQLALRELRPGHAPAVDDPWDCGWWRDDEPAAAAAFLPRRPTLLLLEAPAPAARDALLATLRERSPAYRQALRVLVVAHQVPPGTPTIAAPAPPPGETA